MLHATILDSIVNGYAMTTLWANTNGPCDCENTDECPGHEYTGDVHNGMDAFTEASQESIRQECDDFALANVADLIGYAARRAYDPQDGDVWEHAGHDFALSRNRHGTGFWDRGLGDLGTRLDKASEAWGTVNAWEDEDGTVEYE